MLALTQQNLVDKFFTGHIPASHTPEPRSNLPTTMKALRQRSLFRFFELKSGTSESPEDVDIEVGYIGSDLALQPSYACRALRTLMSSKMPEFPAGHAELSAVLKSLRREPDTAKTLEAAYTLHRHEGRFTCRLLRNLRLGLEGPQTQIEYLLWCLECSIGWSGL